ncbi:MAG: ATP-binding protein, partial [Gammaproteobacteria bacterium]
GLLESVMGRLRPLATKKGLGFSCSSDEDVPPDLVGDGKSIERALSLYVDNALKFTSAGRIELKVRHAPEGGEGLWLRFIVEDTGIGIEPEQQAALFRPFQQGDMSLTRRFGGLGIGLALVRQLVERMGGRVGVESRNGEGSRFWFDVPLERTGDAAVA